MGLFNLHKHDWNNVGAHTEYVYRFDEGIYTSDTVRSYKPRVWNREAMSRLYESSVQTAITQKCSHCHRHRTQWIEGAFELGGRDG